MYPDLYQTSFSSLNFLKLQTHLCCLSLSNHPFGFHLPPFLFKNSIPNFTKSKFSKFLKQKKNF
ncbi:hypothetical protein Hanom_Chr12g01065011 [Helianthus anomalus]